jgi:hypothetical protein
VTIAKHPYSLKQFPKLPYETVDESSRTLDPEKSNYFAIVSMKSRQFKVTKDDTFVVNLIHDVDIGQILEVDSVRDSIRSEYLRISKMLLFLLGFISWIRERNFNWKTECERCSGEGSRGRNNER